MKYHLFLVLLLLIVGWGSNAQEISLPPSTWKTTSADGRFVGTLVFEERRQVRYAIEWHEEEYQGNYRVKNDTVLITLDQSYLEDHSEPLQPAIKFVLLKKSKSLDILGLQEYDEKTKTWHLSAPRENRSFLKEH